MEAVVGRGRVPSLLNPRKTWVFEKKILYTCTIHKTFLLIALKSINSTVCYVYQYMQINLNNVKSEVFHLVSVVTKL